MSNHTTAIVLAAFTGGVAIAGLASLSPETAHAADECLAAPKGATPAGAHWYYRVEKGTKRKCWYLADEVARTGKTAAARADDAAPPAAAPAKPKTKAARVAAVEDAHAELTAADDDQPALAETTWPPMPEQTAQATPPAADAQGDATVAARWPSGNSTSAPAAQPPAPRLQVAAATPAPTAASTDHAAPTAKAAHDDVLSPFRILLIGVTLALALLAALVSVLFKYVWRRTAAAAPASGRTIWDRPAPTSAPRAIDEPRRPIVAHQDVRIDEIEALLRATRPDSGVAPLTAQAASAARARTPTDRSGARA